jgi:hypothetical protein
MSPPRSESGGILFVPLERELITTRPSIPDFLEIDRENRIARPDSDELEFELAAATPAP